MIRTPDFEPRLSILIAILFAVLSLPAIGQTDAMPAVENAHFCAWWQARVGPPPKPQGKARTMTQEQRDAVKKEIKEMDETAFSDPDGVADLSDDYVIAAIGCLLNLENDRRASRIGGVTRLDVNQLFGEAPVRLAALYYISYLFTGNYKHAGAIALRGPGAESSESHWEYITSDDAIRKAYASYRRWLEKVKTVGLATARAHSMSPLEGTDLTWY